MLILCSEGVVGSVKTEYSPSPQGKRYLPGHVSKRSPETNKFRFGTYGKEGI